ncbi:uncharacterized protein LOC134235274 [Saccostrea cucullata]|uniref:uncharacterized protein LOC134235274 n=1 Tax=Saccostrea cuccullata TaxID=36930 RepID=UPI002ED1827E
MSSYKWLDLGIQHLSESVFVELCHILGSSEMVIMRREVADFREMMINQVMRTREADRMMMSGSMKEGLRLEKSDVDTMFWPNDHIVILDLNKAQKYDLSRKTLILCDFSESPPGFGLLELLTPTHSECVKNACMRINDRLYISSSKYRQITCSEVIPNFKEHGPCGNGVIAGAEYDTALCFVCDFWPLPASKWIDRCHSWPHSYIVDEILRNGCHFVAIGHKLGKHADKEWRISFSLAEQKLIYSMNHCQFLTYGLLKLFLKDFKKELTIEEKLLCSYYMKTSVFWVIQQNMIAQWCPQNLLHCFWVCFKLILKWVYEGTLRYKEALSVIEMTKVKLAQPYVINVTNIPINAVRYMFHESLGGQSWSSKIRYAVAWDISIYDTVYYMNELMPEQQSGSQSGYPVLSIPLYVMLHMLEVLCYRHVDPMRAQTALKELQDLVHHDQGMYIQMNKRDISWQILGICQQVTGNHQAALYSYQQSLRHTSQNIQTASLMRIQVIKDLEHRNHE